MSDPWQVEQGSQEWFDLRCGKVTASRIADLMAKTKSGWGASRKNYMAELTIERLTGMVEDSYQSPAMLWGIEMEPEARSAYEAETGSLVQKVGFMVHPRLEDSGASPDGLVDGVGSLEIKCPNSATHIETLLTQKVADKYVKQMQWQMACSGAEWTDFVSYDPRLPEHLRLWVKRVERDDAKIAEIEEAVVGFLDELEEQVNKLEEMAP